MNIPNRGQPIDVAETIFMRRRSSVATLVLTMLLALSPRIATAEAVSNPIAAIVAKVSPAVVRIVAVRPPETRGR